MVPNNTMAALIMVIQFSLIYLRVIAPPDYWSIIVVKYVPIRYICTISRVFFNAFILGGRCIYHLFHFLKY